MIISGLTPVSLIDWDGHPCSVVFTSGCNFRCPWCHNAELVLRDYKHKDSITKLDFSKKFIDHVCITGGEPTMYGDLSQLCLLLKNAGMKVKLDTNGSRPFRIFPLINFNLIDYIAMDIKAPLTVEKYSKATGVNFTEDYLLWIFESIDMIMKSSIDYEFRTTVVPGFHTPKDIEQICKYAIKGAKRYVIQNFHPCDTLIDPHLESIKPFSSAELEAFADAARPYVNEVRCRNV
jgi:pyruvate formate lyase activating enzyme